MLGEPHLSLVAVVERREPSGIPAHNRVAVVLYVTIQHVADTQGGRDACGKIKQPKPSGRRCAIARQNGPRPCGRGLAHGGIRVNLASDGKAARSEALLVSDGTPHRPVLLLVHEATVSMNADTTGARLSPVKKAGSPASGSAPLRGVVVVRRFAPRSARNRGYSCLLTSILSTTQSRT